MREIPNPEFQMREILNPEKLTGDPQLVKQHCYDLIIHLNRKFFFIADTPPKSKLPRRGNRCRIDLESHFFSSIHRRNQHI